MKISFNWLKDFIDVSLPVNEVETLLTDLGLEVEGIEEFESIKGSLEGIVVGKVLECKSHPNADRLKVTQVDVGGRNRMATGTGKQQHAGKGQGHAR